MSAGLFYRPGTIDYPFTRTMKIPEFLPARLLVLLAVFIAHHSRAQLKIGIAKVNVSNTDRGVVVNDSLYVKAMVLDDGRREGSLPQSMR